MSNYTLENRIENYMKKLLILPLVSIALSLASCNNNKVDTSKIALDYGHVRETNFGNSDFKDLTYDDLDSTVTNKESFILITEDGVDSTSCGCWTDFKPVLANFTNKYDYDFKYFNIAAFEGQSEKFGIYTGTGQMPGICFFRRGKLIRQVIYGKSSDNNKRMFSNFELFEKFMLDNIYLPKMYYVDRSVLDDMKADADNEFALYVARKTCGDCKNIEKNIFYKWSDSLKDNYDNILYIFDFDIYRGTAEYQDQKDAFELSEAGNETFGFGEGYFPTLQYFKSGALTDMVTLLNDSVNVIEEGVYTLHSYFTEERIANSPMLRNTGDTYVMDNMVIDPDMVNVIEWEGEQYYILTNEAKIALHKDVTELFINTYLN